MAEKTVIENRGACTVGSDLEQLNDSFRIMQEMMVDQLCNYTPGDEDSMGSTLERLHFLIGLMPEKIKQMGMLSHELLSLKRAQNVNA